MNERAELLKAKKERLYELQRKEALMGYDTPVHNLTEIKKIKEEIRELESQISRYEDGSIISKDITKVVCATIEQLKRLGTTGKVTICVLEIQLEPPALEMQGDLWSS
jgi:hypothetical protein